MAKRFSAADVASHKTASDLWIIVDEDIYDLTSFQEEHPGGKKSMLNPILQTSQFKLTTASPPASSRQGRVKAVLEVPQRQHS
jgi:hypothetical protein